MKTTKILYWVFTILLVALMLFSAIGSFIPNPQGDAFAKHIGFPLYIFKFLAVAKILGVVAILVPGNARLKEWAYAGFTFDMLGAVYAFISVGDPAAQWAPFLIGGLIFSFGSYITYHQKLSAKQA
ncbi:MAG: DoxX family protein [Mucilaginibacter sp.]